MVFVFKMNVLANSMASSTCSGALNTMLTAPTTFSTTASFTLLCQVSSLGQPQVQWLLGTKFLSIFSNPIPLVAVLFHAKVESDDILLKSDVLMLPMSVEVVLAAQPFCW